jgi:hypothetical protein
LEPQIRELPTPENDDEVRYWSALALGRIAASSDETTNALKAIAEDKTEPLALANAAE